MLKSIKIENFYSIGEKQSISFEVNDSEVLDDSARSIGKQHINLVNCLVGANASGKTTVLKALTFLAWLMSDSYSSMEKDESMPFEKHKLLSGKSTMLETEFWNKDRLFKYSIEITKDKIVSEFLGEHIARGYSCVFSYNRNEGDWGFKSPNFDVNSNDLVRFKKKKNVSLFSSLIATGYLSEFNFNKKVDGNVTSIGTYQEHPVSRFLELSKHLYDNKKVRKKALSFIQEMDIGVSEFNFVEIEMSNKGKITDTKRHQALGCRHESKKGSFELSLLEESNGTANSLYVLSEIIPILDSGGIYIWDELESGLHPLVAKKIISLFESKNTNPNNAQLIFSTHLPMLLKDRTKTQIFIAEKDKNNLETEVYRLDEIDGVRNDENYAKKYIEGVYGGTPDINWLGV